MTERVNMILLGKLNYMQFYMVNRLTMALKILRQVVENMNICKYVLRGSIRKVSDCYSGWHLFYPEILSESELCFFKDLLTLDRRLLLSQRYNHIWQWWCAYQEGEHSSNSNEICFTVNYVMGANVLVIWINLHIWSVHYGGAKETFGCLTTCFLCLPALCLTFVR